MPEFLGEIQGQLQGLWGEATTIWSDGGWAMYAIAVIALVMFAMGLRIHFRLREKGFTRVPERVWRRWLAHPEDRRGPVGELLDQVDGGRSLEDTARLFDQVRSGDSLPFERDLRLMKVCVGAAPLVGLLGTVTGMLATFGALSSGSGGDQTMAQIAKGISEALITTMTGLVVALPGLFFQYHLGRSFERYKAFLAHLETVVSQDLHRRSQRRQRLARAALQRLAGRLQAAHVQQKVGRYRTKEESHGTLS